MEVVAYHAIEQGQEIVMSCKCPILPYTSYR